MKHLAGQVVIVTGASSGIGAATSLACAHEGARVALIARRQAKLEAVAEEVRRAGGEPLVLPADLADTSAAPQLVDRVRGQWGRVDVLVNNAGQGLLASFEQTPPEELRHLLELNVVAVLTMTQAVLPVMRRQGSGHVINISSVAGRRGTPWRSAYSATKFALGGMTESLRQELAGSGIHVSLVYPVNVPTEFQMVEVRKMQVPGRGPTQTAEQVAAAIVRCAKRPRPDVYPYRLAKGLAALSVVAPSVVDALAASATGRATRQSPAP